jgi:hypothetical protein
VTVIIIPVAVVLVLRVVSVVVVVSSVMSAITRPVPVVAVPATIEPKGEID